MKDMRIMSENIREIVLDTLLELEKSGEYSHKLIKAVLDKYDYLDSREKSFIKRVTEGTIERKMELTYYLNHFSSVPVKKMKPLIRNLLCMSTYQILYMDSVPDSAVCNEACKLAAKRGFHTLKGFVNGVLRNISRQKGNLPLPDKKKDTVNYFSIKYSMPATITGMFLEEYGSEITGKMLEGLLQIHPVSIRFSTKLSDKERGNYIAQMQEAGVKLQESPYLSYVYTLENTENIAELPGFAEGAFTVQDVSSALCVEAAGISGEDFVMDICAAPGGKTMLAAEKAKQVLSRDVSEEKIFFIEENLRRMGAENVTVKIYDATCTDEAYIEKADVLLMDVPCSGLGVMGKKRDIKYNVTAEGLQSITALQKEIIQKSWQYVKPGGILLYSTCTINRAENEEMVHYIAENFPFVPESLKGILPKKLLAQKEQIKELQKERISKNSRKISDEEGFTAEDAACIQFLPGFMESDGFFIARFRRKE